MRGWREERGQSLVEFALVLPMLLVVCIGMAEVGRVTWAWNLAQQAAAEGARRAIVVSNSAWSDTAKAVAQRRLASNQVSGPNMLSSVSVTTILDDSTNPRTVQVNVDVPVTLLLTFWESGKNKKAYTVRASAKMDCQPSFYKPSS